MGKKVTVFGSFVVDLMGRTPHLPAPGETVKGSMFKMGPGGKGFNQGVAAHKAGAEVTMVTKIGKDTFGAVALEAMKELAMDAGHVFITEETETGAALIMVDESSSQNEIVVVLGACNTITDQEVESLTNVISESEYLLTQLETNVSSVEKIVDIAYANGVKIILNTAPVQPIKEEVLEKIYLITPNEVEAEILTGIAIDSEEAADKAAHWFFARGVENVLITLGGRGVYLATKDKKGMIPAYHVEAVDTTGAGDAFNGG
ncbi:MAG: ribokinase, partial [Acetivibrio sp.]